MLMPRLIAVILLTVIPVEFTVACVRIPIQSIPAINVLRDSDAEHVILGVIVDVEPPLEWPTFTVRVSEVFKGVPINIVKVKSGGSYLLCGFAEGRVGDYVFVRVDPDQPRGETLRAWISFLDPKSSYAGQLRQAKLELQSNPTVEPDARKSGARASP